MKSNRGSAYFFVLIMLLGILLMLTAAANITAFEAQVSHAYKRHSSLSLLARSGVERAVFAINSQLRADRGLIAGNALARLTDGDYIILLAEEVALLMNERFAGSEIVYELSLDAEKYRVIVRITSVPGGFRLVSEAAADNLPTAEQITADIMFFSEATAEDGVVTGEFGYRIENLKQNR